MSGKKVYSLTDFGSPAAQSASEDTQQETRPKKLHEANTDMIYVDFSRYIDVDMIHRHISEIFEDTIENLEILTEELEELMTVRAEDESDAYLLRQQIDSLNDQIDKLWTKVESQSEYPDVIGNVIREYKSLFPHKKTRIIGSDDSDIDVKDWLPFQRIASEFISIAQRFTDNIVIKERFNVPLCSKCQTVTIMVAGNGFCPKCKQIMKLKDRDTHDITSGMNYSQDHSCTETVEEAMQCLQGIVKKPVPAKVYQAIEAHCAKYDINVKTLSKPDVLSLLHDMRFSEHYKAFNLIAFVLTGAPLPNVRKYQKNVIARCKLIEKEYAKIKEEVGRKNFMFAWYVLRACLVMEGYKAKKEDFLTLTTRGAAVEHDCLMKRVCKGIYESLSEEEREKTNWVFDGLA